MPALSFFEIEGRAVAKGVSGGKGFAFVFNSTERWVPAPGLVKKVGSSLSQTSLVKEFSAAAAAIDDLKRLAQDVPEAAFA